jgi:SAM-dependent methyltransferase
MAVKCKVCDSNCTTGAPIVHSSDNLILVKCPHCGFIFDWDVDISVLQGTGDVGVASGIEFYLNRVEASRILWDKEADRITKLIKPPGKALDVGCGIGGFLQVIKSRGFDIYGVELNPDAIDYVRSRDLFPIYTNIQETAALGFQFDVVTLLHTLEHVSDPRQMLREIKDVLEPNGLLVITVPCYNRLTILLDKLQAYTGWGLIHKGHQNYFSSSTLRVLLQREGFLTLQHPFGLFGACIQRKTPTKIKWLSRSTIELLFIFTRVLHLLGIDVNLTMYATKVP